MNAIEVLAQVIRSGGEIIPDPDHPRIKAPQHLKTLIENNRDELRNFIQQEFYSSIPIEVLANLNEMTLSEFAGQECALEVLVPGLSESLWFVPGDGAVVDLTEEGISRGRIWTAREISDLLSVSGMTKEKVEDIARVKIEFDGRVVGVKTAKT